MEESSLHGAKRNQPISAVRSFKEIQMGRPCHLYVCRFGSIERKMQRMCLQFGHNSLSQIFGGQQSAFIALGQAVGLLSEQQVLSQEAHPLVSGFMRLLSPSNLRVSFEFQTHPFWEQAEGNHTSWGFLHKVCHSPIFSHSPRRLPSPPIPPLSCSSLRL